MSQATTRPKLVEPGKLAEIKKAGNLVAKDAGGTMVSDFFEANKDAIRAVLPQHMTPDRMLKIALRALRTTPKLAAASLSSLLGSVVTCAQLGLEPNTPLGHAYLLPFEREQKQVLLEMDDPSVRLARIQVLLEQLQGEMLA